MVMHQNAGIKIRRFTNAHKSNVRSDAPLRFENMAPDRSFFLPTRTFRLVRSVKGIGSRTTSLLEKLIEDVVVGVLPGSGQNVFAEL